MKKLIFMTILLLMCSNIYSQQDYTLPIRAVQFHYHIEENPREVEQIKGFFTIDGNNADIDVVLNKEGFRHISLENLNDIQKINEGGITGEIHSYKSKKDNKSFNLVLIDNNESTILVTTDYTLRIFLMNIY